MERDLKSRERISECQRCGRAAELTLQKPQSERMLRQVLEGIRNSSRPSSLADSDQPLALNYIAQSTNQLSSGKTVGGRGRQFHWHQFLHCERFTSYFTHRETNSESFSNLLKYRVDTHNLQQFMFNKVQQTLHYPMLHHCQQGKRVHTHTYFRQTVILKPKNSTCLFIGFIVQQKKTCFQSMKSYLPESIRGGAKHGPRHRGAACAVQPRPLSVLQAPLQDSCHTNEGGAVPRPPPLGTCAQ